METIIQGSEADVEDEVNGIVKDFYQNQNDNEDVESVLVEEGKEVLMDQ